MIDLYKCLDNGIKLEDISERPNNKSGEEYVLVSVFLSPKHVVRFYKHEVIVKISRI